MAVVLEEEVEVAQSMQLMEQTTLEVVAEAEVVIPPMDVELVEMVDLELWCYHIQIASWGSL